MKLSKTQIITSVLLLFFIIFLIISNIKIKIQRDVINNQIKGLEKEVSILEQKNNQLKESILQSGSREYLEKTAREQFNLKAPGEEVIVISKEKEESTQEQKKQSFFQWLFSWLRD